MLEANIFVQRLSALAQPVFQNTHNTPIQTFNEILKNSVELALTERQSGENINNIRCDRGNKKAIGVITENRPTVSHLLIDDPEYGKACWDIIHSEKNSDKAYRKIQPGTTVYLDRETNEILWGNKQDKSEPVVADKSHVSEFPGPLSQGLDQVIRPYMGKPYNEIDCYELVVQGLKDMGIRYGGPGGLKESLVMKAAATGRPYNAYLTGEGLINHFGTPIYTKLLSSVENPEKEAGRIIDDLKPILKQGMIISFSTPGRGHTGIISRNGSTWTFINSGKMDNHVGKGLTSKGVGEEFFEEEILNWLKLANTRNESLEITLGRFNEEKLAAFQNTPRYVTEA